MVHSNCNGNDIILHIVLTHSFIGLGHEFYPNSCDVTHDHLPTNHENYVYAEDPTHVSGGTVQLKNY